MKVVIASHNQGKIKELRALLQPLHIELLTQAELGIADIEETGLSFVENAIAKARNASLHAHLPALADDSGLIVPSLKGEPGIYSARYAGKQGDSNANIAKLLKQLENVTERQAYFYCVIAFFKYPEDPAPIIATGEWHGSILDKPSGNAGFGYDPVFYLAQETKTAAELALTTKNKISHRGQAIQSFINQLTSAKHPT